MKKTTPTTKETQAELRKAAVQPERKTTRSSNRSVKETSRATSTPKTTSKSNKSTSRPATARSKPIKEAVVAPVNENDVCIFCEEVNPEFNEDTLIKHYYNTCPVLTNCSMCQIVRRRRKKKWAGWVD